MDSIRLLEALDREAAKQERTVPVLLEVNASGESNKHGFAPADVLGMAPAVWLDYRQPRLLSAVKQMQPGARHRGDKA